MVTATKAKGYKRFLCTVRIVTAARRRRKRRCIGQALRKKKIQRLHSFIQRVRSFIHSRRIIIRVNELPTKRPPAAAHLLFVSLVCGWSMDRNTIHNLYIRLCIYIYTLNDAGGVESTHASEGEEREEEIPVRLFI